MSKTPEQIQHEFYSATSERYDEMHVAEGDPHHVALDFVSALISGFGYTSVLDVGAGTGRGVRHFIDHHPAVDVRGVEPVRAMIDQAETRNGVPPGAIIEAPGAPLPFTDASFDAACELGVLHHVRDPAAIVAEMTRVARRAVFLSDENRFGRGRPVAKLGKFALHAAGLWPLVYRIITRGRSYRLSAGDGGVVYSYSVYDSLPLLGHWADRVFMVPLEPVGEDRFHPLFAGHHLLLVALRD